MKLNPLASLAVAVILGLLVGGWNGPPFGKDGRSNTLTNRAERLVARSRQNVVYGVITDSWTAFARWGMGRDCGFEDAESFPAAQALYRPSAIQCTWTSRG